MAEIEQKYYSVREISQIHALKPAVIRAYCHAKGQSFAYQMVKSGKTACHILRPERRNSFCF